MGGVQTQGDSGAQQQQRQHEVAMKPVPPEDSQGYHLAACAGSTLVLQRANTLPNPVPSAPPASRPNARPRSQSFTVTVTALDRVRTKLGAGELVLSDISLQGLTSNPVSVQTEALSTLIRKRSSSLLDPEPKLAEFKRKLSMGSPFRLNDADEEQDKLFESPDAAPAESKLPSETQESAPSDAQDSVEDQICAICCAELARSEGPCCECVACQLTANELISKSDSDVRAPSMPLAPFEQLCNCGFTMCHECIAAYIQNTIQEGRFSCPTIRCPGCGDSFRCRNWRRFVPASEFNKYIKNARDLLSLRCYECDDTKSLFAKDVTTERRGELVIILIQ